MRLFIAIGVFALAIGLGLAYNFFVADGTSPVVMTDDEAPNGRASIDPSAPPPPGEEATGDGLATDLGATPPSGDAASQDQLAQTTGEDPGAPAPVEEEDGPFRLSLPVDCEPSGNCLLFSYPDAGTIGAASDYSCGPLTRAAETTTEIRLIDHIEMESGISVLASAPGTVVAVRDDLPDVSYRLIGLSAIVDDPQGNFIEIEHRDGYVTTYSHLRRGTAVVSVGDSVGRGQVLAQVGMSGATEHPVLGFEVDRNGLTLDPFTGLPVNSGCETPAATPLWNADLAGDLIYRSTSLLYLGFADRALNRAAVEYSMFRNTVASDAEALVLHAYLIGVRPGDGFIAEITGPDGSRFVKSGREFTEPAQVQLLAIGRQDLEEPLAPGVYEGTFEYFRPDPDTGQQTSVISFSTSVTVR